MKAANPTTDFPPSKTDFSPINHLEVITALLTSAVTPTRLSMPQAVVLMLVRQSSSLTRHALRQYLSSYGDSSFRFTLSRLVELSLIQRIEGPPIAYRLTPTGSQYISDILG